MGGVVSKMGATVWERVMLYKDFDQSVLLYGSESWMVIWSMLKVLEIFHHHVSRSIMGVTERLTTSRE